MGRKKRQLSSLESRDCFGALWDSENEDCRFCKVNQLCREMLEKSGETPVNQLTDNERRDYSCCYGKLFVSSHKYCTKCVSREKCRAISESGTEVVVEKKRRRKKRAKKVKEPIM